MKKPLKLTCWSCLLLFDLKMKLSIIFVLFSFFVLQANETYGQLTKISLDLTNVTVGQFLDEVENNTEFRFIYKITDVNLKRKITINVKKDVITNILNDVFKNTKTKYRAINKRIYLTELIHSPESKKIIEEAALNPNPQTSITGEVMDKDGQPLPRANILEKGTTNGTQTDFDGKFTLPISDSNATLTISYIGFISQDVALNERREVSVVLLENEDMLDEVVVIGYGSVRKSDLTGSVSSISSEEITQLPTIRIDDALQGRATGLQVTSTGSTPGAKTSIRIRGSNSLNSDNEPLYVIDGFVGGGDLNSINTNDIASIEVLKDASSTAIYGSRGSNGVILITTKRGKKGQVPSVRYDSYVAIQTPINAPVLPTGPQFAALSNEAAEFSNPGVPTYESIFDPNNVDINSLPTTNWFDLLTRNAVFTNHSLSVIGGSEKTSYYFSGNYLSQEGLYNDNELERFQFKVNLDQQINDWLKIGFTSQIGYVTNDFIASGDYGYNPVAEIRDELGNFIENNLLNTTNIDNPLAEQEQRIGESSTITILSTAYAEVGLAKGLKYKFSVGVDYGNSKSGNYNPNTLSEERNNGTARINTSINYSTLLENTISYNTELRDGADRLDVVGGYTWQSFSNESFGAESSDFVTNATGYDNLDGGATRQDIRSERSEAGLTSWLLRANYSLNDEFKFTVSGRADAASQFSVNNKWAFFPSGAIAWIGDKYLKSDSFLNSLKLRTSYGSVGNVGIKRYSSLAIVSQASYILGTGQNLVTGFRQSSLNNPDLKWETTTQFDIGAEFGLFNNRLNIEVDYYTKTTNDLIASTIIPRFSGASSFLLNFGQMKNTGFEVLISSVNIRTDNFSWTTNFNISTNKNEVVEIAGDQDFVLVNGAFAGFGGGGNTAGIVEVGRPLGLFYGYVQDGVWNTQEEIDAFPKASADGKRLGGTRWVDTNDDGVVDADDRTIIGDANPDFFGGLTNSFSYKRFELSAFLQFNVGNDVLNFVRRGRYSLTDSSFLDRWTPSNTDSKIPRSGTLSGNIEFEPNSSWIEDGSFLRLRILSLAYNLPTENFKFFSKARIYFTVSNLFTITDYTGFDPDINGFKNSSTPGPFNAKNVTRGYDTNANPSVRNFTLGLNITL